MEETQTHAVVREGYARVAKEKTSCCGPTGCGTTTEIDSAKQIGYSEADLAGPAATGNLGLGCGNPTAIANLQPGDVVVDLGSGAGFDALLAAEKLGSDGRFIGVDMTPEMLARARTNAVNAGYARTIEFREGLIEALPVASGSADVIISNCVINLSPDKSQVFRDAYRVLKPGGRLAISDVVASIELPDEMRQDPQLISGCMGNAALIDDLEEAMRSAGFSEIRIQPKDESREFIKDWAPGRGVEDYVLSATIEAFKPGGCCGGSCC